MNTKQLRQKILDLAIRGKLVAQNPNDEPASVLLERIRAEKERLIKEGKIKRDKHSGGGIPASDKPHYGNTPFELPDGWAWVRLEHISRVIQYGLNNSAENSGNFRLLRITDIQDDKVDWNNVPFTTITNDQALEFKLETGDILFARTGATVGKSYIVSKITTSAVFASYLIRVKTMSIYSQYIKHFFGSGMYWEQIIDKSVGIGQPNVNGTKLKELILPIPPLAEQHRIVTAIESAFAVIDEIERDKTDLQSAVAAAKRKILSLAVSGKLVPEDPGDEPASVLLERIRSERETLAKAGKTKRGKTSPATATRVDTPHYPKLPDSWDVCVLDDILEYEQPTAYIVKSTDYNDKNKIPVLTAGKSFIIGYTNESFGSCENLPVIIFDDFTTDSRYVDFKFKVKSSAMKILRSRIADIKYVFYFMQTIECNHATHKRYWISDYSKKVIALPPLSEQRRIVTAIETAFEQLDGIAVTLT